MIISEKISDKMLRLKQQHLIRARIIQPKFYRRNQPWVNFSSNDYLGLSQHPEVKQAFVAGINQYGVGSGSSALICGYHPIHDILEKKFAEFLQRDKALLFNSGYHANLGVITALAQRQSHIFSDRLCHASIIDAICLSRAEHTRFNHNNPPHLNQLLEQSTRKEKLIITEGVFSMSGQMSDLANIAQLADDFSAMLVVDDAHGIGTLGSSGKGVCEFHNLTQTQVPVLIAPLGKAFGALGAIVAGKNLFIEHLIQWARTYRYTTALPPAIAQALFQALNIISRETWRRVKLHHLSQFFLFQAQLRQLPLDNDQPTPIHSIIVKNNLKVLEIQKTLSEHGFLVAAIRPPTVPPNTARIRISLNCLHNEKQIHQLLDLISRYYEN